MAGMFRLLLTATHRVVATFNEGVVRFHSAARQKTNQIISEICGLRAAVTQAAITPSVHQEQLR